MAQLKEPQKRNWTDAIFNILFFGAMLFTIVILGMFISNPSLLSQPNAAAVLTLFAGIFGAAIGGIFSLRQTRATNEHAARLEQINREENKRKEKELSDDLARRAKADFYLEILRPLRDARTQLEPHKHRPEHSQHKESFAQAKGLILTIPDKDMSKEVLKEIEDWERKNQDEQVLIIDTVIKLLGELVYSNLFPDQEPSENSAKPDLS